MMKIIYVLLWPFWDTFLGSAGDAAWKALERRLQRGHPQIE
jgi:hypothetical protein